MAAYTKATMYISIIPWLLQLVSDCKQGDKR